MSAKMAVRITPPLFEFRIDQAEAKPHPRRFDQPRAGNNSTTLQIVCDDAVRRQAPPKIESDHVNIVGEKPHQRIRGKGVVGAHPQNVISPISKGWVDEIASTHRNH